MPDGQRRMRGGTPSMMVIDVAYETGLCRIGDVQDCETVAPEGDIEPIAYPQRMMGPDDGGGQGGSFTGNPRLTGTSPSTDLPRLGRVADVDDQGDVVLESFGAAGGIDQFSGAVELKTVHPGASCAVEGDLFGAERIGDVEEGQSHRSISSSPVTFDVDCQGAAADPRLVGVCSGTHFNPGEDAGLGRICNIQQGCGPWRSHVTDGGEVSLHIHHPSTFEIEVPNAGHILCGYEPRRCGCRA